MVSKNKESDIHIMFEDDPTADSFDAHGKFYNLETYVFTCTDDEFENEDSRKKRLEKLRYEPIKARDRMRRHRQKLRESLSNSLHASKPE